MVWGARVHSRALICCLKVSKTRLKGKRLDECFRSDVVTQQWDLLSEASISEFACNRQPIACSGRAEYSLAHRVLTMAA